MEVEIDNRWYQLLVSNDDMTHKVKSKVKGIRSKTFKGETAWMDAKRYIWDNFTNIMRGA